jgi:glycosyltransferase involved in cell wall biosynthesis
MNNSPLVSVIIPTYNRVNIVGNAIKSVLNQTYTNIELIVVDDGSTDKTSELIENFPEVLYLKKTNGGQSSARNMGLKHAKGKYIASLDSDDLWETTFLTKMVEGIEKNNLDFAFANWHQYYSNGEYIDFLSEYIYFPKNIINNPETWVHFDYSDLRKTYITGCPSPSSSLLIRSSSIISGWNEEINIADDWYLLLEIILKNEIKVGFTKEILWKKHVDSNNVFDGRNRLELLKLLYIEDKSLIIKKFKPLLSTKEIDVLEKEYVLDLIFAARETLNINTNIKECLSFTFKAIKEHPLLFVQSVFKIIFDRKNMNKPVLIQ